MSGEPKHKAAATKEAKWYDAEDMVLVTCTTKTHCGHCDHAGGAAHAPQCHFRGCDYRVQVEAALVDHVHCGGEETDFVPPEMVPTRILNAGKTKFIQAAQTAAFKKALKEVLEDRCVRINDEAGRMALEGKEKKNKKSKVKPRPVVVGPPAPQYPPGFPGQFGYGYNPMGFPGMNPYLPHSPFPVMPQMPYTPPNAAAQPEVETLDDTSVVETLEDMADGQMAHVCKAKRLKAEVAKAKSLYYAAYLAQTKAAKEAKDAKDAAK
jgi:hypothetical protein